MGQRAALTAGPRAFIQTVGEPPVADGRPPRGFNAQRASSERKAFPAENLDAYKKALARTGDYVRMLGLVDRLERRSRHARVDRAYRHRTHLGRPGDLRLSRPGPSRRRQSGAGERVSGYKDGPDVNLKVGFAADRRHPPRDRQR